MQHVNLETRAKWRASAAQALNIERDGLAALAALCDGPLGEAIADAVALIASATGRVIVSGMGKSGHIGRKIASTLASTGTPASFVHPAEASHGDLGMITPQDVVLILSNSGESAELRDMLDYTKRFAVPLIAICAREASSLGQAADVVLLCPQALEACPIGLAPTTSTLLQLALGVVGGFKRRPDPDVLVGALHKHFAGRGFVAMFGLAIRLCPGGIAADGFILHRLAGGVLGVLPGRQD